MSAAVRRVEKALRRRLIETVRGDGYWFMNCDERGHLYIEAEIDLCDLAEVAIEAMLAGEVDDLAPEVEADRPPTGEAR